MIFAGLPRRCPGRPGTRDSSVALYILQVHLFTTLFRFTNVAVLRLSSASSHSPAVTFPPGAPAQGGAIRSAASASGRVLTVINGGFSIPVVLPWVRRYDLPTYRPPPYRFTSPDTGPRLFAFVRPAPRSHIGGSLFATYAGSTSCFLSTRHFCSRTWPVGVALPMPSLPPAPPSRSPIQAIVTPFAPTDHLIAAGTRAGGVKRPVVPRSLLLSVVRII